MTLFHDLISWKLESALKNLLVNTSYDCGSRNDPLKIAKEVIGDWHLRVVSFASEKEPFDANVQHNVATKHPHQALPPPHKDSFQQSRIDKYRLLHVKRLISFSFTSI